jgi:hypothetical protein
MLALVLLAVACGGDDADDGFSKETRDAYLSGCVEGGNEDFCNCTLDELEEIYTESEFLSFVLDATEAELEEPPEEFAAAIDACNPPPQSGG